MKETTKHFEKTPLQSKKFWAFLISYLVGAALLVLMLLIGGKNPGFGLWILQLTWASGLIILSLGSILGQAYVDKFVRLQTIQVSAALGSKAAGALREKVEKKISKDTEEALGDQTSETSSEDEGDMDSDVAETAQDDENDHELVAGEKGEAP